MGFIFELNPQATPFEEYSAYMFSITPIARTLLALGHSDQQRLPLDIVTLHCNVRNYGAVPGLALTNRFRGTHLEEILLNLRERGLVTKTVFQLSYLPPQYHKPKVSIETRRQVGIELEEVIRGALRSVTEMGTLVVKGELHD